MGIKNENDIVNYKRQIVVLLLIALFTIIIGISTVMRTYNLYILIGLVLISILTGTLIIIYLFAEDLFERDDIINSKVKAIQYLDEAAQHLKECEELHEEGKEHLSELIATKQLYEKKLKDFERDNVF